MVKNQPAMQETQEMWVGFLGQEDPLEERMVTPSSILAWKIPLTEESGGLQSIESQRAGHNRSDLAAADPTWQRWKQDRNCLNVSQFHWNG